MAFYDKFPYTNFQEINLDRLIRELIEVKKGLDFVIENASLKYADPIQWNITHQYQANTVVIDPATGIAYISTQPVPDNVQITDTNYWTPIFDLSTVIGDVQALTTQLQTEITDRENADIALQGAITSETTNRENADIALQGAITSETTNRENADIALQGAITLETTNRENADIAMHNTISTLWKANVKLYGAVGDGVTDDSAAVLLAIQTNGSIYFPAGSYNLNGTLITLDNTATVIGEDAILLNPNFIATGNSITIRDLVFKNTTANYVISVSTGTRLLIDGCEFTNILGGLDIENVQHAVISNCLFWNFTGRAIWLHNINDVFMNNLFINGNNNANSVGIQTNNKAEALMFDQVEVIQCYRSAILSNIAYSMINAFYSDSSLGDGITLASAKCVQMTNIWVSNRAAGHTPLSVSGPSKDITIKGLTAYNNGGGARIVLFNTGSDGVTVTDSTFTECSENMTGIELVSCNNVKLIGNTFDSTVTTPILVTGSLTRSIVMQNVSHNSFTLPTSDSTHINANNIIG